MTKKIITLLQILAPLRSFSTLAVPDLKTTKTSSQSRQKTRVLLFTNSVAIGGMEKHVELIAQHLDHDNFEVFVICPEWKSTEPFNQSISRFADHFKRITPDRRYGLWKQTIELWRFYRQLKAWRIEVMHMHSTTYLGQWGAFLAARLAGVRRIFVTEHLAPEQSLSWLKHTARNLFSRTVNGIVCISEKNYQSRASYIFTPRDRTIIINNGVDLDDFKPVPPETLAELRARYQLPENARIVGSVVRFEPEKGLNYLVEAMVQVKAACPDAYLLLVGDGSLRPALEEQVAQLGLTETVRFTGFQSNPQPFIGLINAFVLPVPFGSMSIGLLEAMAMERAVVITFGGEGEAVIHNESGLCAEPRNPTALAEAIIRIVQNPDFEKALGVAAKERVESHFSAQQVARSLEKLYSGSQS